MEDFYLLIVVKYCPSWKVFNLSSLQQPHPVWVKVLPLNKPYCTFSWNPTHCSTWLMSLMLAKCGVSIRSVLTTGGLLVLDAGHQDYIISPVIDLLCQSVVSVSDQSGLTLLQLAVILIDKQLWLVSVCVCKIVVLWRDPCIGVELTGGGDRLRIVACQNKDS